MNLEPLLNESIEFTKTTLTKPWMRWAIFLLLGIPGVIISFLVDTKTVVDGSVIHWDLIPWPQVIPLAVIGFILSLFLAGYIVRLLRGGDRPPEFDRWTALCFDGIRLEIIIGIWTFPLVFLLALTFTLLFSSSGFSIGLLLLMPILAIAELAFLALLVLFGAIGVLRFARSGKIRDAFAFSAISSDIGKIGWGNYFVSLIIIVVVRFVFGLVTGLFSPIIVIGILLPFVFSPPITVFTCRFIAQVYDAGVTGPGVAGVPSMGASESPGSDRTELPAPDSSATAAKIFLYGIALVVVLAACLVPLYFMLHALAASPLFSLPSLTADELKQSQQDDISVYNHEGYLALPLFTRDGSHIVYLATVRPAVKPAGREFGSSDWEEDIWIMDRTGKNQTRLTNLDEIRRIDYSPAADAVAFSRYADGKNSIVLLRLSSPQPVILPGPLPAMYFSSWSPDGKQIAATGFNISDYSGYGTMPDGGKVPATGTAWSRLFVLNADGSNPRELTRVAAGAFDLATESSWSPDGKYLAVPVYEKGASGIGIVDTATGSVRKITLSEEQAANTFEQKSDYYPRWSPNGDLIAFIRKGDVWTITPDGSGLRQIVRDGTVEQMAWNPDGSRLAFSAENYLGLVNPDGRDLNRISNIHPGPISWSPDGKAVTYTPMSGIRIRITTLSPGVLKTGEYMAQQMDRYAQVVPKTTSA